MLRKIVIVLSLILLLDSSVDASKFNDVKENYWGHNSIVNVTNKGYMNGNSNGEFKPNKYVTKFEAVEIMADFLEYTKAKGEDSYKRYGRLIELYDNKFSNWKSDANYKLAYLMDKGIIIDKELNQFVIINGLGEEIVRTVKKAQLSSWLAKYISGNSDINYNNYEKFKDHVDINEMYVDEVYYLKSKGIVNGNTKNEFNPGTAVKKVVFAALLDKTMKYENKDDINSEETKESSVEKETEVSNPDYMEGKFLKITSNVIIFEKEDGKKDLAVIDDNTKFYVNDKLSTQNNLKENMKINIFEEGSIVDKVKAYDGDSTDDVLEGKITKIVIGYPSKIEIDGVLYDLKNIKINELYDLKLDKNIKVKLEDNKISSLNYKEEKQEEEQEKQEDKDKVEEAEDDDDEEDETFDSDDVLEYKNTVYDVEEEENYFRMRSSVGLKKKFYVDDDTKMYSEDGNRFYDLEDLKVESEIEVKYLQKSGTRKVIELKVEDELLKEVSGEVYLVYTSSRAIKLETDDGYEKFYIDDDSLLYDRENDEIDSYEDLEKGQKVKVYYKDSNDDDIFIRKLEVIKPEGQYVEGELYRLYTGSQAIRVRDEDRDTYKIYVNDDTNIFTKDDNKLEGFDVLNKESTVEVIYEENKEEDLIAIEIKIKDDAGEELEGRLDRIYSSDRIRVEDEDGDNNYIYIDENTSIYDEDGDKIDYDDYDELKENSNLNILYRIDEDDKYLAIRIEVDNDFDDLTGEIYYINSSYLRIEDEYGDKYKIYYDKYTDIYDEDGDEIDEDDYELIEDAEVEIKYIENDDDYEATSIEVIEKAYEDGMLKGEVYYVRSSYIRVEDSDGDKYKIYIDNYTDVEDEDGYNIDEDDYDELDNKMVEIEYDEEDDDLIATDIRILEESTPIKINNTKVYDVGSNYIEVRDDGEEYRVYQDDDSVLEDEDGDDFDNIDFLHEGEVIDIEFVKKGSRYYVIELDIEE